MSQAAPNLLLFQVRAVRVPGKRAALLAAASLVSVSVFPRPGSPHQHSRGPDRSGFRGGTWRTSESQIRGRTGQLLNQERRLHQLCPIRVRGGIMTDAPNERAVVSTILTSTPPPRSHLVVATVWWRDIIEILLSLEASSYASESSPKPESLLPQTLSITV